jgi:hypothetical protein
LPQKNKKKSINNRKKRISSEKGAARERIKDATTACVMVWDYRNLPFLFLLQKKDDFFTFL